MNIKRKSHVLTLLSKRERSIGQLSLSFKNLDLSGVRALLRYYIKREWVQQGGDKYYITDQGLRELKRIKIR